MHPYGHFGHPDTRRREDPAATFLSPNLQLRLFFLSEGSSPFLKPCQWHCLPRVSVSDHLQLQRPVEDSSHHVRLVVSGRGAVDGLFLTCCVGCSSSLQGQLPRTAGRLPHPLAQLPPQFQSPTDPRPVAGRPSPVFAVQQDFCYHGQDGMSAFLRSEAPSLWKPSPISSLTIMIPIRLRQTLELRLTPLAKSRSVLGAEILGIRSWLLNRCHRSPQTSTGVPRLSGRWTDLSIDTDV